MREITFLCELSL